MIKTNMSFKQKTSSKTVFKLSYTIIYSKDHKDTEIETSNKFEKLKH